MMVNGNRAGKLTTTTAPRISDCGHTRNWNASHCQYCYKPTEPLGSAFTHFGTDFFFLSLSLSLSFSITISLQFFSNVAGAKTRKSFKYVSLDKKCPVSISANQNRNRKQLHQKLKLFAAPTQSGTKKLDSKPLDLIVRTFKERITRKVPVVEDQPNNVAPFSAKMPLGIRTLKHQCNG